MPIYVYVPICAITYPPPPYFFSIVVCGLVRHLLPPLLSPPLPPDEGEVEERGDCRKEDK